MLIEKTACHPGRFSFELRCRNLLKPVFLTDAFYQAYPKSQYSEIEEKTNRPYIRIEIEVNGILWGIPMRSHIRHEYAIWTDKENGCGLDLTKAVVIEKPDTYISLEKPHIREKEFQVLKQLSEYQVVQKFQSYVKTYQKAKKAVKVPRNRDLVKWSTLQYFEDYI